MFLWLVGGAALFVSIIVAVLTAMQGQPSPSAPPPVVSKPKDSAPMGKPPESITVMGDGEFLAKAEPLAKRFLEARSVQDILPLVRNPLRSEPRIKAFYPEGRIEPMGLNQFNTQGEVDHVGNHIAVHVRTGDFEERRMNFVLTPEGIRIDWESWVAWSEVPWSAFLADKPSAAKVFRVRFEQVDYYNAGFSDDAKWQSYQLAAPGQDKSIYGYVERGSNLDQRLHLPSDVKQSELTLRLRFPENARSVNQVLIDGLVSENWVIENETSP